MARWSFLALALHAVLAFPSLALAAMKVHGSSFVPDRILRVTAQNVSMNCESRYSVVVNGSVPGPVLRIPEAKITWIRVYNDMKDQNLTMHWHGLSEAVAPFADGTPQVSQWPIPPLHYFDYEVFPDPGMAGTYFYHSHVGLQAMTAAGALIVEDPGPPPFEYAEERIVVFSDYFNKTDQNMTEGLLAKPFVWTGEVINVLANGYAMPNGSKASDVCESTKCALEHIKVKPSTTYRFRFVAATGLSFLSLAFQNHEGFKVIEADGKYTQPYPINHLQITTGQRYSLLFTTKSEAELAADQAKDVPSYYIQYKTLDRPKTAISYAVLDYEGFTEAYTVPPPTPPLDLPNTTLYYLEDLAPLQPNYMPPATAVSRTVTVHVQQVNTSTQTPQIFWAVDRNTSWTEDYTYTPFLVSVYQDVKAKLPDYDYAVRNGGFDDRVRAFPANVGEVLDIVIQNVGEAPPQGPESHPMHMHGLHYYYLGSGNGTYNATANEERLAKMAHPPVLRDSTVLYKPWPKAPAQADAGWLAWRLNVTAPGVWMMHCHTTSHMVMGMQSVFVFGGESDVKALGTPQVAGYLEFGGGAYGNYTHDPFVNEYYG